MRFDTVTALDGLDFTVAEGSIVAVMGPSGCGKSTLLRVVAGLQPLSAGRVHWRGEDITEVPTHERGFGLMFQDYALFPHRNVEENVAFGLRMQGWDDARRRTRVAEMVELVGLAGYAKRAVDELSGGEQQRVALARTLAPRPGLVMLDEPLGSLDRTLRDRLLAEMRDTFTRLGVTAIYVTHDQDEAFTMGEHIAIMRAGTIEAMGTDGELWTNPQTMFVARLVGHDNVLTAGDAARLGLEPSSPAVVIPTDVVEITPAATGSGRVMAAGLRSGRMRVEVVRDGVRIVSTQPTEAAVGDTVSLTIPPSAAIPLRA